MCENNLTDLGSVGCPWWLSGKESAYSEGDLVLIPWLGSSLREENGYPLPYSCLENSSISVEKNGLIP